MVCHVFLLKGLTLQILVSVVFFLLEELNRNMKRHVASG